MRKPEDVKLGEPVIWIDSLRNRVPALVQAIHGGGSCINVVIISLDENKTDMYGRQIEHQTSCNHASMQNPVVGCVWHYPEESFDIDEANVQTQR